MPELTREEKLKLVEKLPQRLQDFLYSEDTGAFLLYLGQKYGLIDEKISALSKIVADIILKITPITSLAQEIVNKVISDPQIAMTIAQKLNSELLMPVLTPTPITPAAPVAPPAQVAPPTIATAPAVPVAPAPMPASPQADRYREPATTGPEIIDLRKTPPPQIPGPVSPAPIPPSPRRSFSEGGQIPTAAPTTPVLPPTAPKPLTFTKPIEKPALIEADPHKTQVLTPTLRPPVSEIGAPTPAQRGVGVEAEPQYIIRPPGLPPTDLPHDVLDLRKDKGEF